MLDIHMKWLLVLVANFLGLLFLLNIILFKPLLRIFKERQDSVKGALDAAREMSSKKEEGIASMSREIAAARGKAKELFEGMRDEGLALQKKFLAEADVAAAEMLQKAREELRTEVARSRERLKADVEKFSDEIVRKLVKA